MLITQKMNSVNGIIKKIGGSLYAFASSDVIPDAIGEPESITYGRLCEMPLLRDFAAFVIAAKFIILSQLNFRGTKRPRRIIT